MEKLNDIVESLKLALNEIFTENTMEMAAALSYSSMLAVVPLATVIFSMFSLFPMFNNLSMEFQDFVYTNMVPAAGDIVRQNIDEFVKKTGALTTFGLAFLLVTVLMMLSTLENNLNKIFAVEKGRNLRQRILVYWTMISLGPILFGAGISLTTYFAASQAFDVFNSLTPSFNIFKIIVPLLLETAAFVLGYMMLPNCKVNLNHALIGGLVASALFQLAKKGFALYLSIFNSYEVIYGALATLPVFLIWVFVCWCVFLLGAQITAALGRMVKSRETLS